MEKSNSEAMQERLRAKAAARARHHYSKHKKAILAQQAIKRRSDYLRLRRNITQEQFNEMLEKQNNKCAICETVPDNKRDWHVDHSHRTNQVRAILCRHCNALIGFARENVQTLLFAAEYLSYHHSLEWPPRD